MYVAELAHLITDEFGEGRVVERGDGSAGVFEQRFDMLVGQVGNGGEVRGRRGGEELGGGIALDEFEDPADGDVLDEECQFGKGQGEQLMELVDEAGALADGGLESSGDLAERAQLWRQGRRVRGSFADGKACAGAGLDGIGLLAAEESGTVVLVALRIATRDGERGVGERRWRACCVSRWSLESMQEVEEVVGVLPGGVEADDEVNGAVALGDAFEALAELGIAGGGLDEGQFVGRGLQVGAGRRRSGRSVRCRCQRRCA